MFTCYHQGIHYPALTCKLAPAFTPRCCSRLCSISGLINPISLFVQLSCVSACSRHSGIIKRFSTALEWPCYLSIYYLSSPWQRGLPSPSVGGLFSSPEDHSSPTRPAMLVDLQFRRQFVLVHFCAPIGKCLLVIIRVYTTLPLRANLLLPSHTMLLSPQRAHVILASKGTQLRSNEYVLFGVLVCFRHRRALTVHLCHLRSEHSGNVRIKRNPHYHVSTTYLDSLSSTSTEQLSRFYIKIF